MQVKNKLYKHHKSKFVLIVRNFSIAISGLLALGAIVGIPTYISDKAISEAEAANLDEEYKNEMDFNERFDKIEIQFTYEK